MMKFLWIWLILTLVGPLWLLISGDVKLNGNWRTAERDTAHIAPDPQITTEPIVQIYAARSFNWRGLFSVHTWIAAKPLNATHYRVYQVIGWRALMQQPVLAAQEDLPDRHWFGVRPRLILDIRGQQAADAIRLLEKAATNYPYQTQYHLWPGPNSNTFTAYLIREIPQLATVMPSNAVGKDFLGDGRWFAKAPSGTGYQVSVYGLFGVLLAKREGLEINFLGLVYGINPLAPNISLPGIGVIGKSTN